MSAKHDVREAMRVRTTGELRRVLTDDAADYTDEALAIAREELARRGEDTGALVPKPAQASKDDASRSGAMMLIAALFVALVTAPFVGDGPVWARIAIGSAITALALVGAKSFFSPRR